MPRLISRQGPPQEPLLGSESDSEDTGGPASDDFLGLNGDSGTGSSGDEGLGGDHPGSGSGPESGTESETESESGGLYSRRDVVKASAKLDARAAEDLALDALERADAAKNSEQFILPVLDPGDPGAPAPDDDDDDETDPRRAVWGLAPVNQLESAASVHHRIQEILRVLNDFSTLCEPNR